MGFTTHENKTPIPPNAERGTQSIVRVLNFKSWGVNLSKNVLKNHRIFQS